MEFQDTQLIEELDMIYKVKDKSLFKSPIKLLILKYIRDLKNVKYIIYGTY